MVPTCAATVLRVPASPRLLAHLRPRRRRPAHLRMVAGVRAATGIRTIPATHIRTIPAMHSPTTLATGIHTIPAMHIRTTPAMHIPTTLATGIPTGIRTPTRRRMLRCARCSSCWASLAQFSLQS